MKKLIALLAIIAMTAVACGGGGTAATNDDGSTPPPAGASPGTSPAPAAEGAPTITSISGTGADGIVFDSIKVTGTNYDDAMDVYLVTAGETLNLEYSLVSENEFEADLPADIETGDYELNVKNVSGKATAPLSLLQGEPGIALEHYYACGASSDLNADSGIADEGRSASIYEFSDGSYFMSCMSDRVWTTYTDYDSSTTVTFLTSSLAASMGYIKCIPMFVNATYFFDTNIVRYTNNDDSYYQDIACSQIY